MPPYNASIEQKIRNLTTYDNNIPSSEEFLKDVSEALELTRKHFNGRGADSVQDSLNRIQARFSAYERIISAYQKLIEHAPKAGLKSLVELPDDVKEFFDLRKPQATLEDLYQAIRDLQENGYEKLEVELPDNVKSALGLRVSKVKLENLYEGIQDLVVSEQHKLREEVREEMNSLEEQLRQV